MSASGSKLHALRTTCCWFRRSKIRISYSSLSRPLPPRWPLPGARCRDWHLTGLCSVPAKPKPERGSHHQPFCEDSSHTLPNSGCYGARVATRWWGLGAGGFRRALPSASSLRKTEYPPHFQKPRPKVLGYCEDTAS